MSRLVIDRALHGNIAQQAGRAGKEMLGIGADAGFTGAARSGRRSRLRLRSNERKRMASRAPSFRPGSGLRSWNELLRPPQGVSWISERNSERFKRRQMTFGNRVHLPVSPAIFFFAGKMRRECVTHRKSSPVRRTDASLRWKTIPSSRNFTCARRGETGLSMPAGRGPASTASRVDAFLLRESLKFRI